MPLQGISIQQAQEQDRAACTDVFGKAFGPRRPFQFLMPGVPQREISQWMLAKKQPRKDEFWFKAVDDDSQGVVGWMLWRRTDIDDPVEGSSDNVPLPKGANAEICKNFFGTMDGKLKTMGQQQGKLFHELVIMCVKPEFERRGIAQALLAKGLAMADEEDAPIIVSGSENGAPLYLRSGFEKVDSFTVPGDTADAPDYTETQLVRPRQKGNSQ